LTGAIFAVEVLAIGLVDFQAIVPCLIASIAGDWMVRACGIHHTGYHIANFLHIDLPRDATPLDWLLLGKVAIASVAFGLASVLFAELTHGLQRVFKWLVPWPVFRPALGAVIVIALAMVIAPDYLGLGVTADPHHPNQVTILSSFHDGGATPWSWWWKILFTAVTLSSGFKGGEVTPLFFVGASLGNTIARILHAPIGLFAGLGFVGVFAGATNTPLACTIMGIELFGGQAELIHSGFVVYLATACFLAYLLSGHSGIYLSQRIAAPKAVVALDLPPDASLRNARELQPGFGNFFAKLIDGFSNKGDPRERDFFRRDASDKASASLIIETFIHGGNVMAHRHKVQAREIGQVRIYMTPREKRKSGGIKGFFGKPLYQEIIDAAKADGILNAVAHHTHYGYSGNGQIQSDVQEIPNSSINLCVELIGEREQLEQFCRQHGDLLKGRVIVYKHMEHWDIHEQGPKTDLQVSNVPVEELDVDVDGDAKD
jgi:PII-like signaling protein